MTTQELYIIELME